MKLMKELKLELKEKGVEESILSQALETVPPLDDYARELAAKYIKNKPAADHIPISGRFTI